MDPGVRLPEYLIDLSDTGHVTPNPSGSTERILPVLVDTRVKLMEQPFSLDQDALLDGFDCPITIAADESAQRCENLPVQLVGSG